MQITRSEIEGFSLEHIKQLMGVITEKIFLKQNEFRRLASLGVRGDDPGNPYNRKHARRLSKGIEGLHKEYRLLSNGYDNALGR